MTMLVNLDHNRENGWVKLQRSLLQHREDGTLKAASFHVMVTALAMADARTGIAKFTAQGMADFHGYPTRKPIYDAMTQLFQEGFLTKLEGGGIKKHGYKVRISNYEITKGTNAGKRTPHRLTAKSKNEAHFQDNLVTFEESNGDDEVMAREDDGGELNDFYSEQYGCFEDEESDDEVTIESRSSEGLVIGSSLLQECKNARKQEDEKQTDSHTGLLQSCQGLIPLREPAGRMSEEPPAAAYSPAAQGAYSPLAAEKAPAARVCKTSGVVEQLVPLFKLHMPTHKTMLNPKLRKMLPEKLELLANEPMAPAVLHWIFNAADASYWRELLVEADYPASRFVANWEAVLKAFEEKTSGTKQKSARASTPSTSNTQPSGPRVEQRVPFGNPLTRDQIRARIAESRARKAAANANDNQ
jgi:hypothetical protein